MAGLVRDDPARLRATVDEALAGADVVVVSGGSSAGMRDHTVDVFTSVADSVLLAHGAAISPGKPFILAKAGDKCMMGLPGHVASALICARVFLLPLLDRLHGRQREEFLPRVSAVLSRAVASAPGRRDFIRVRLERTNNGYVAEPVLGPSGLVSGLVAADALVVCPENREGLYAGEQVEAELLL